MNCTGCPTLRIPLSGAVCALGIKTSVLDRNGDRVTRHPLSTCNKPRTDAELTERLDIIARERV